MSETEKPGAEFEFRDIEQAEAEKPQVRTHFKLSAAVMEITPEVATEWLGLNHSNRSQRARGKEAYSRDIAENEWLLTGDTIKFDWFGNLIDGQHRLEAVVLSGKPITSLVVWGVDPKAQNRMDSGIPRSFKDQLQLAGNPHAATISAAARRIFLFLPPNNERIDFNRAKVTHAELERVYRERPELDEISNFISPLAVKLDLPKSLLAFIFWVLREHNPEEAYEFMSKLASGASLEDNDPILVLRDRIRRNGSGARTRDFPALVFWLTVYAWNHWLDGKKIAKLQLPAGGMVPDNFPAIRTTRKKPRKVIEETAER